MDKEDSGLGGAIATGAALAITVGAGYVACALAFMQWPDAAMQFMNSLFHGLDFRKLQSGPVAFSFAGFSFALIVAVAWAFALGTLFGWLRGRYLRERRP